MGKTWKKGRGKLGFLQPLLGRWMAEAKSEMGPVRCTRSFESVLGGAYVRLDARWEFGGGGKVYEEQALIGSGDDGKVCFWSFTSDGKRSQGTVADVTDLHPEAVGFEAQMPAGLARMAYWPDEDGGFVWVVESKNVKGVAAVRGASLPAWSSLSILTLLNFNLKHPIRDDLEPAKGPGETEHDDFFRLRRLSKL